MNVAYVLGYMAARYGGPPQVAVALSQELVKLGCNISFWATGNMDDRRELDKYGLKTNLYKRRWPKGWFHSPDLASDLMSQADSFDIIHMHGTWTHPIYAGVKIAHKSDTHCLITPHGAFQPWALGNRRSVKALYLALLGRRIFDKVACLHAVTSCEAENFRSNGYQGPITIIPNGVDIEIKTELPDGVEAEILWPDLKNRQVVLFMSRLSPEKGLDLLIPVWADLIKSAASEDTLLVIAGPDDRGYRKVVEGMIDRYDMGSRILMAGMVRGRGKLALLRRADVFILPSYSENFGIVVGEALACGTPVITTTGTPWQELEDVDAGLWVPPRKPELYQALRELMDKSESQRKAMGHRGRRLVLENYNWDKIARQLLTVYSCILQGKNIPLHPKPYVF